MFSGNQEQKDSTCSNVHMTTLSVTELFNTIMKDSVFIIKALPIHFYAETLKLSVIRENELSASILKLCV